jgi:CPA1 family monovalent cation:H+ antiporter
MLSFLLFAGALHINLEDLTEHRLVIALLATVGLVLSTAIIGVLTFAVVSLLGIELSLLHCLVFGALISPTDPIAVLAILKQAGAPRALETQIAGESLFNDGVAVVLFLVLVEIASGGDTTATDAMMLLVREAAGGVAFGLVIGGIAYVLLRGVDDYQVEVLITLALVVGGYALAMELHISGPIAVVVAGLLIGNHGRRLAMSDTTRDHLDTFWELIDEVLNAVLFVLIGLEVLLVTVSASLAVAAAAAIVIVLVARFVSAGLPVAILRPFRDFSPRAVRILTWGGLRGGISVALALSLAPSPQRDVILTITYGVVLFSILVQGLTIGRLVRA